MDDGREGQLAREGWKVIFLRWIDEIPKGLLGTIKRFMSCLSCD